MIEQSVRYALLHYRKGEPAILLNEAHYPPKSFIIRPLVYENLPACVFALAAMGKSLLALFVCLLAETGQSLCGLSVSHSHQTLFLDWELDACVTGYRKQQIIKAHPTLETAGPLYRRMYRPLSDDLHTIQKLIQDHAISFLVIDSLALAVGGDQIGSEGSLRFFESLRVLGVGCLILAHAPKNAENKSIYGNVFNHNLSRSVWEIQSAQEEGGDEVRLGLYHKKNNLGRLQASFGMQLTFPPEDQEEPQGIFFKAYDLSEDGEL